VSEEPLICPTCDRIHPRQERFCLDCGMPLVYLPGVERDASERQRKARKIKPQYADGELVSVAHAENEAEAEFIEGLLLEEGIPSIVRRSAGFGVESLASGPREVLVPESGAQAAREALKFETDETD
jgi:hypothetical protein